MDEQAGLTQEVVEARLAELEAPGPRLPRDVAVLEKQRPSASAPPLGAEGNPRWGEYVAYYEKRLGDIKQGKAAEAPLRWAPYEQLWGWFTRGLAFERSQMKTDAARLCGNMGRRELEPFLQALEQYGDGWMPDIIKGKRQRTSSRSSFWKALEERRDANSMGLGLTAPRGSHFRPGHPN